MAEQKTEWVRANKLKIGEELEFQPAFLDGMDAYSVWDNTSKKFLRIGEKIQTSKGELIIEKGMKFNPLTEEERKRWRPSVQYSRKAIINGKEVMLTITQSIEKELKNKMADAKNFGTDPLSFTYVIKKLSDEGFNRYEVRVGKQVGMPKQKETQEIVLDDKPKLTEFEQQIVKKINEQASHYTKEQKLNVFIKNRIDKTRAEEIVKNYF